MRFAWPGAVWWTLRRQKGTKIVDACGCRLEIDLVRTRQRYGRQLNECDCTYCRNYGPAATSLPADVVELLRSLGADPPNPVYVSEMCTNADGTHRYWASYDVVGRMVSPKADEAAARDSRIAKADFGDVTVYVNSEPIVPGHFPTPAVEIEVLASLPWVLGEEPEPDCTASSPCCESERER